MQIYSAGDVSSNPAHATMETPLVGKATGNHLIKFTSLGRTQHLVSGFCYVRNQVCNVVILLSPEQLSSTLYSLAMAIEEETISLHHANLPRFLA